MPKPTPSLPAINLPFFGGSWNAQPELQHAQGPAAPAPSDTTPPAGGDTTPPAADPAPAPAPSPAPAPKPGDKPADPAPGSDAENIDGLPEWAQKEIRGLRRESQTLRGRNEAAATEAAQKAEKDIVEKVAKLLGLGPDETSPEALLTAAEQRAQTTEQRAAAAEAASRAATIESAVLRAAPSVAIGDALMDSRSFTEKVAALDPTADDFRAQVAAAVKEAVDSNPTRYATKAPAAPASTDGGSTPSGEKPGDSSDVEGFRKKYSERRDGRP